MIDPGVEKQNACRLEVFRVPSHDVKTVTARGRRDETIASWNHLAGPLCFRRKFTPDVAGLQIHDEDAEEHCRGSGPSLRNRGLRS